MKGSSEPHSAARQTEAAQLSQNHCSAASSPGHKENPSATSLRKPAGVYLRSLPCEAEMGMSPTVCPGERSRNPHGTTGRREVGAATPAGSHPNPLTSSLFPPAAALRDTQWWHLRWLQETTIQSQTCPLCMPTAQQCFLTSVPQRTR